MLDQSREIAAALRITFSAFAEKALRDKLITASAHIAARHERAQGRDSAEHFAEVETERAAMVEAIRADGARPVRGGRLTQVSKEGLASPCLVS
ncbi:hypothetical protein [Nocardia sp. NBC_01327]|uniref:hypothetical protein n=1 Tax=Nocardia sp. NBC_01327 TaxID=2903593 RepID=UPI002E14D563|nr:hypothetical protein OG326_42900 [Nocardia sp. NBC_01327]